MTYARGKDRDGPTLQAERNAKAAPDRHSSNQIVRTDGEADGEVLEAVAAPDAPDPMRLRNPSKLAHRHGVRDIDRRSDALLGSAIQLYPA